MSTFADENESKQGLVDYVVRFAIYLPHLLGLFGTPAPVAQAVGHAIRLVPAVRNGAANDTYGRLKEASDSRFASILAAQKQLGDRCDFLEQENIKMKFEFAGVANQLQLLKAETQALRAGMESMQQRNFYLSLCVLAIFVVALSGIALRFVK